MFDGAHIWVAGGFDNVIRKVRAVDGAVLSTTPTGTRPLGSAYDGANVWVVSESGLGGVNKIRASDGADLGFFTTGIQPVAVAFDGTHTDRLERFSEQAVGARSLSARGLDDLSAARPRAEMTDSGTHHCAPFRQVFQRCECLRPDFLEELSPSRGIRNSAEVRAITRTPRTRTLHIAFDAEKDGIPSLPRPTR